MLRPPHTTYSRIYTYHLEGGSLPGINDPDLIGAWEEDGKTIMIFHKPKQEFVESICRHHGCRIFYQADMDYSDWEMGCEVAPFTIGSLTVAPCWSNDRADIKIDSSVVFGNGFHPSTRLCLEALIDYAGFLGGGFTAMDLGCGTGLLAISAVQLGASAVTAVDYNSLACEVTRKNARENNAEKHLSVKQLDLKNEIPDMNVDVVMANLHHELLACLFDSPRFWRAKLYLLSGFMPHDEEKLLGALPENPPNLLDRRSQDRWRLWILGKV